MYKKHTVFKRQISPEGEIITNLEAGTKVICKYKNNRLSKNKGRGKRLVCPPPGTGGGVRLELLNYYAIFSFENNHGDN